MCTVCQDTDLKSPTPEIALLVRSVRQPHFPHTGESVVAQNPTARRYSTIRTDPQEDHSALKRILLEAIKEIVHHFPESEATISMTD